jgi:hypothetical protein
MAEWQFYVLWQTDRFGVPRRWDDGEIDSSTYSDKRTGSEYRENETTARLTVLRTLTNERVQDTDTTGRRRDGQFYGFWQTEDEVSLAGTGERQRRG